ncbi:MAG: 1-acyl-sn-glycerol-3-phosphate acyltransferase [Spirochaetes bacterium]|nr:1-acyl-sn-glycerol-3-phosphate acyltransferase [Spirochaetota bacterium]
MENIKNKLKNEKENKKEIVNFFHTRKKEEIYEGGLKYSKLIKGGKFKLIPFLRNAYKEGKLLTTFKILWRTLLLGFEIPFAYLKKKTISWKEYSYLRMKSWGEDLCKIAKINLKIIGEEFLKLNETYLFASNHLSPYDIPVLSASIPVPNGYIANKQFTSFFVTHFWVRHSGGVFIDKHDKSSQIKSLKDIADSLRKGNNLILFPEGYMSKDGELQSLYKGGLMAAYYGNALLVPTFIYGTREVCKPGEFGVNKGKDVFVAFDKPLNLKLLNKEDLKNIDKIIFNKLISLKEKIISIFLTKTDK